MGVGMAGLLSFAGFALATSPAVAATVGTQAKGGVDVLGDSKVVNGCMARWWSTAFNMKCDQPKVTQTGNYQSVGTCPFGEAYGPSVPLKKGDKIKGWVSAGECNISVKSARVSFSK